MSTVKIKGTAVNIAGDLPRVGAEAPDFIMTKTDLADVALASFRGRKVILNIFPSVDTSVCAMSVRKFNEEASKLSDTVVICISMDLPFALKRFCGAEGIENVETVSAFRSDFAKEYEIGMTTGPMRGLLARAVIVLDRDGIVRYKQLVADITNEPDYERAIAGVKSVK